MNTQTIEPVYLEYRCKGCWHSNIETAEAAGSEASCRNCGRANTVPQSTPESIERAFELLESHPDLRNLPSADKLPEIEAVNPYLATGGISCPEVPSSADSIDYRFYRDASVGLRFLGFLIDAGLYVLVCLVGIFVTAWLYRHGAEAGASPASVRELIDLMERDDLASLKFVGILFVAPALFTLLQWVLISFSGQTVAKKMLMMRIVTENGQLPGFLRGVLLRSWVPTAMSAIPFIGPFVPLIDGLFILFNGRKCVHDYTAGTRVVSLWN
ncbi:MAG: RDD family protein [Planctomycetota bacterium]